MLATESVFIQSTLWTGFTLLAYAVSLWIYKKAKHQPLLHPLVSSALLVIAALALTNVNYQDYQKHAWLLSFLLGPATVALAIPLYKQIKILIRMGWRVLLPICVGGTLAPALAWLSIYGFDTPLNMQMTLLVKSITTPLAMGTAEAIGGSAALAAVFVIVTGIVGAVFAPFVFAISNNHSDMAQGIALGTVAHAVGTSKAISISETCAAFATLAVCLNGIMTAIMVPLLFT